jgi:hypothetical protein
MINITAEAIFPFAKLPAEMERLTGDRIHRATAERWRMRGCRGVRLETVLIGGKRYCSSEALQRFVEATTAAADGTSVASASTPAAAQKRHDHACRQLDAAGICVTPREKAKHLSQKGFLDEQDGQG